METEQEKNTTTPATTPTSTPVETSETPAAQPVTETITPVVAVTKVPFYKKHKAVTASVLIALILLAGAGYYVYTTQYGKGPAVAVVGEKKIYQKEFAESVSLIEQNATAQGMDLADPAVAEGVKNQALEILINNALLITAAEKAGIVSSPEDVQVKYDELVTQLGGVETLTAEMAKVGLTEEKLRSNIQERVLADKYIESATDIETLSVSEEEVAEFVKTVTAGGQEMPPIEQIRPQIESQLLEQKFQKVVADLLVKLRSETTVDINI